MAKKGKWAHLTHLLPKFYGNDQRGRQPQIDELKRRIQAEPGYVRQAVALAHEYMQLRREKHRLKAQLSVLQLQIDAITQLMDGQFENEDVTSIKLGGGSSVRIQIEPYTSIENLEANQAWARRNGMERKMRLPWPTLNSTTKELLAEGEDLPDGVKLYGLVKAVFTDGEKSKGGEE